MSNSNSSNQNTQNVQSNSGSWFQPIRISCEFGGRTLTLETNRLAKQADGSVLVTYGETMVLVTAVSDLEKKDVDFVPLTVEFQEKFYAAGRIPGGFFKREGRPSTDATLTARLIDRPIRPLFPEGYAHETQVVATVLSVDKENDPEVLASIGASAALHISSIPFLGPTSACRVGRVDGKWICNPSLAQQEQSDIDVFVAGTEHAIMMVEGGARIVPEDDVLQAILFGHEQMKPVIRLIHELREKTGAKAKRTVEPAAIPAELKKGVEELVTPLLKQGLKTQDKSERYQLYAQAETLAQEKFTTSDEAQAALQKKWINAIIENLKYNLMRSTIISEQVRIDQRNPKQVRPITCEAGILPRAHGSGLFTRGETQVLAAVTLGTGDDEQMIDSMRGTYNKRFMLNYNFPPFSVGEVGRIGTPGRREVGHGALAERALFNAMPVKEASPYTVRLVCEVLESNGSSSMGSVCSGSMALMDAGIPLPEPVAGIAMGLIKEKEKVVILSDILGDEDHLGDMDFKVAGTAQGVTAIQMDIKIEGVNEAIMRTALQQAHEGRQHILKEMAKTIQTAKTAISEHAPRFTTMKIKPDKIREVIGSGGKVIKGIIEKTGVKIDVQDDGTIKIASNEAAKAKEAEQMIKDIVAEPEIGRIYDGTVKSVVEFGAFVEIMPNTDGLLHVSEIAHERVKQVRDHFKEGDKVQVKVLDIDRAGKIRLSRKVLIEKVEKINTPQT